MGWANAFVNAGSRKSAQNHSSWTADLLAELFGGQCDISVSKEDPENSVYQTGLRREVALLLRAV